MGHSKKLVMSDQWSLSGRLSWEDERDEQTGDCKQYGTSVQLESLWADSQQ